MQIGSDFDSVYRDTCSDFEPLGPVAETLLRGLLDAEGLRVHSIRHRIKAYPSLRRKLEEKGSAYTNLSDVHDLLGVRVITFFPDEIDAVSTLVEQEFFIDQDNSVDKRALLNPDSFGYLSVHYVASLHPDRTQHKEHTRFEGMKFEIQIRSILQHAWAEIEHDLGYQTPGAIPDSVRRRFSRVAGLLEIADDESRRLRDDAQDYRSGVSGEITQDANEVRVNRDSVAAFIQTNQLVLEIDQAFADQQNVAMKPRDQIEDLEGMANSYASDLIAAGYSTIGEVETELETKREVVERFFSIWMSGRPPFEMMYPGTSLFYLCYLKVGEAESLERAKKYLADTPIQGGKNTAKRIVDTYTKLVND